MRNMESSSRVGIGIMIFKEGRVLLGRRKGSHGEGQYSFPGGHLEYMESFEACALREIEEECGLRVKNLRFQCLANVKEFAPKHYVHIGLAADWVSGEAEVREPDKCESWEWYALDALPKELFGPCRIQIQVHKNRMTYFDADAYEAALEAPEGGTVYDKLIRDRIPEIIQSRGIEPEVRIADEEEYARRLAEKLIEEAHEFSESGEIAELADTLEVLEAICAHRGVSLEVVQAMKTAKAKEKGRFRNRIVLKRA